MKLLHKLSFFLQGVFSMVYAKWKRDDGSSLERALSTSKEIDPNEPVIEDRYQSNEDRLVPREGENPERALLSDNVIWELRSEPGSKIDYGTRDPLVRELVDLCLEEKNPVPLSYIMRALYYTDKRIEKALRLAESEGVLDKHHIKINYKQ